MAKKAKPWPKIRVPGSANGPRTYIDKERIRREYLEGDRYIFKEFCAEKGYRTDSLALKEFPLVIWQQQWIEAKSDQTIESLVEPAIKVKSKMMKDRLDYVSGWGASVGQLKVMIDYKIRQHMVKLQRDVQKEQEAVEAARRGEHVAWQPEFKLSNQELAQMVSTARKIQEMHRESLLMTTGDQAKLALPVKESDPIVAEAEAEGERLRELGPALIDGTPLNEDVMTRMLSKWIDQQAAEKPETEPEDPLNAPVTPIGDDD